MTEQLRFTVGVSTLDRPDRLARCLDAILAGSRLPDEIIVVDQGADPRTAAVVAERSRGNSVHYIKQPRRGLSAARNAVVSASRCSIVAVTDDDCVPDPGWLDAIAGGFGSAAMPAAVSGRVLALGPDAPGSFAVSLRTGAEPREFTGDVLPWHVATGANFAARREWLLRVGGYDERLGAGSPGWAAEDLDLTLRLLRAGATIRYEPAAIVYHERQDEARRLATRWAYGHGIGAVCGMFSRRGDRYGVVVLAGSLRAIARRSIRSAAALDPFGLRQAALSLAGTIRGFAYGWRIGRSNVVTSLEDTERRDGYPIAV